MASKKNKKRTKQWFKIEYVEPLENTRSNINGFEVKLRYVYDFDITSACKSQNISRDTVIDYYAIETCPADSIKLARIKKLYDAWS